MSRIDLLPGAGPVLTLRQALYRAGRDYHGGMTRLAFDMGLDVDTLQKKLNHNEERRWPTPDELEEIVQLTASPRLLDALVRPAGAVWYGRNQYLRPTRRCRRLPSSLRSPASLSGACMMGPQITSGRR